MSRWKSLPESLDPQARRLVVQLRQLKDHSGLSLAALARKTYVSRSSWQRYLNGEALPSRQAVEAMARVTGADAATLLALWEVAAARVEAGHAGAGHVEARDAEARDAEAGAAGATASRPPADGGTEPAARQESAAPADPAGPPGGGAATGAVPAGASEPDPPAASRRHWILLAPVMVAAVAALSAALLAIRPWGSDDAPTAPASPTPSTAGASPRTYPCLSFVHDGRRYTGHSTTRTEIFGPGSNGEPIAEVQCLVKQHGYDPGAIDGIYGPNTKAAVMDFQRDAGLPADGIVGPATWKALRDG